MATNMTGIEKKVEIDRKENLHDHRLYWFVRRAQDIVLSSVALVVLSPVMLITAIAIVVDDPSAGPIFSQERIGRNGKPFKFYKFRSMCPNAEAKLDDLLDKNEMDGPVFKIKDDPRITRVGKFIRKTSIDELPQLLHGVKNLGDGRKEFIVLGNLLHRDRKLRCRHICQHEQVDGQTLFIQATGWINLEKGGQCPQFRVVLSAHAHNSTPMSSHMAFTLSTICCALGFLRA